MKYFLKLPNSQVNSEKIYWQNWQPSGTKNEELHSLDTKKIDLINSPLGKAFPLPGELQRQNIKELEIRNQRLFFQKNEESKLLHGFRIYTPNELNNKRVIQEKAANIAKVTGYLMTPLSIFGLLGVVIFFGSSNSAAKITISGPDIIVNTTQNGLLRKLFATPLSTILTTVPAVLALSSIIVTIGALIISHSYYQKISQIKEGLFSAPTTKLDEVLAGSEISLHDKQMLDAFRGGA